MAKKREKYQQEVQDEAHKIQNSKIW